MHLTASERFLRDRRKASPEMTRRIDHEIGQLATRMMQLPTRWFENYAVRKGTVVDVAIHELEVGRSYRILTARFGESETCLLMCGEHDNVYGEWDRNQRAVLDSALRRRVPFDVNDEPDERVGFPALEYRWAEEHLDSWAYFLSDQQMAVVDAISESIVSAATAPQQQTHLILGGPGTGKTAVLLKLLELISDLDDGLEVGFRCTPRLAEYLTDRTNLPIDQASTVVDPWLLLVDDPQDITQVLDAHNSSSVVTVAGLDPLQLERLPTDNELEALTRLPGVSAYALRDCYRQKAALGTEALAFSRRIAESTPFADSTRIKDEHSKRQKVHALALDMDFTNPSGFFAAHDQVLLETVRELVDWLQQQQPRRQGWPDIAIVTDQGVDLSEPVRDELTSLHADFIDEWQITPMLKGLEYNHVIVFLTPDTWSGVFDGFSSTGQREYNERRKLRIPFSRARDSLVVFRA